MKGIISALLLFIFHLPLFSFEDVRLLTSDKNSTTIEFIPSYDSSTVTINNGKYIRVSFFDGYLPDPENYGVPAISLKKISIGVPSEFGNTIQIISSEYKDIAGRICPVPRMKMKNGITDYVYEINEKYNSTPDYEIISFSDYGMSRGLPLQIINIAPVQFDPKENKIRLYTRIVFRVNFAQVSTITLAADDDLLRDAVINYKSAKNWIKRENKLKKTVTNSVLASGKWYRFEAPEEGIYKINRQMLSQMGIDPVSVVPVTIKIYNNGGKELPESVSSPRPEDLQENAIYIYGEEDGKFDTDDYILFYGRGINFWESDTTGVVKRYYHNYSQKNYYWITSGGSPGKRMQSKVSTAGQASFVQTTTKAFTAWEEDKSKLQPTGRLYLGDEFGENSSRTYTTNLDGLIPESRIDYKIYFVSRSEESAVVVLQEHNVELLRGRIQGIGYLESLTERGFPYAGVCSYSGLLSEEKSTLKISYLTTISPSIGFLNYFEIIYNKYLKAVNGQLLFYSPDSKGTVQYELSGFPSGQIEIFDITNYSDVKIVSGESINGGDCSFRCNEIGGKTSKYFAVENNYYKTPVNIQEIANSNLHGIQQGAKFIIITHKNFKAQAERLKQHKENNIKVKIPTMVADIDDIYNEFSCGLTDVCAIRDFIKYAYDNWIEKPEYVLLFGDGDYDYKNIEGKNQNFIIPYESTESFHYLNSFVSDDFYSRINGDDQIPDIAIGRLNVITDENASTVVDKIISYETKTDFGLWRNLITLVADDGQAAVGDPDELSLHTNQSEILARTCIEKYFDQAKIYLVLFPTIQIASGRSKPAVSRAIIDAVNEGTLILNYVGHGNPDVWSHESVFRKSTTIPELKNDKLFFLTAATCDFGRYDIPGTESQSSTELMLVKPDGGSIGTFTAARTVYSDQNAALNEGFYKNLFRRDTLNLIRPVGKSYFITKMNRYNTNDIKFHLFGDPTLRLAAPEIPAQIDSINNLDLSAEIQVKALSNLTITGTVSKSNGAGNPDFNGEAIISVYDSERNRIIKEMDNYSMSVQGGLIYRGKVTVVNGKFNTCFTVPKDISYENKNGKITAYVYNETNDGIGYTNSIIIGGTDSTKNDGKGPEINIGFDDDMSENTYLVKPDFVLDIKLQDQTGLNTTGTGIGHKLEGILNENEKAPIDFTNYFVGDLNSGGKSGVIKYKFNGLDQGDYNIQVKAWDVFNNLSTDQRNFTVVNGDGIVLRDVFNYPNPFESNTTFTFQHNFSEAVDVKINVYTVTGRKIKTIEKFNVNDKFVRLDWDGRDEEGNAIANGTYLYKVIVKSPEGNYNHEVLGKLAIIK